MSLLGVFSESRLVIFDGSRTVTESLPRCPGLEPESKRTKASRAPTRPPLRDALPQRACRPPPITATVRHRCRRDRARPMRAARRDARVRSRAMGRAGAFWGFRAARRSRGGGRRAIARGRAWTRVNDDDITISSFVCARAVVTRVARRVRGEMGDGPWMRDAPALGFSGDARRATDVARARLQARCARRKRTSD